MIPSRPAAAAKSFVGFVFRRFQMHQVARRVPPAAKYAAVGGVALAVLGVFLWFAGFL
jgi:hypothetical protein